MEKSNDLIFDKSVQTKMLILFVMSRCTRPVAIDMLTELALCDERISYFDVTECVHMLLDTKHLRLTDNKYSITAKGKNNSKILEADLPFSVKAKAQHAVSNINNMLERDSQIITGHSADEKGGYLVSLSLADGISEILKITLHTADTQQASQLEKGFRANAHTIYHDIIKILTQKKKGSGK